MTEEELKNIEAPTSRAPLTETQKRKNAFWLQMFGALVLLVSGFVLVVGLEIGAIFFFSRVVKADPSVMQTVSLGVIAVGIVIAWFISRQACKALVLKTKIGQAVPDDVVDFYSGK